jgi:anthrone oxygenase-like protein
MSFEDVLRFVNVFTSGLTAGILVVVMTAVVPAMLSLPDDMALRYKQKLDPLVDRINPPAVITALVSGILVLVVADNLPTTATVATIVGLVGSAGVAATSLGVNMRINRRMGGWSVDAPPAEFRSLMARWNASHVVRTLFGLTAFVGYLIGVLAVID